MKKKVEDAPKRIEVREKVEDGWDFLYALDFGGDVDKLIRILDALKVQHLSPPYTRLDFAYYSDEEERSFYLFKIRPETDEELERRKELFRKKSLSASKGRKEFLKREREKKEAKEKKEYERLKKKFEGKKEEEEDFTVGRFLP